MIDISSHTGNIESLLPVRRLNRPQSPRASSRKHREDPALPPTAQRVAVFFSRADPHPLLVLRGGPLEEL
jgi:hypothetical protein